MDANKLADKLISWIRDRVSAAGCKGVVVGMSGGLDSSVIAVLCQYAFPQSILGLIMPCHSHPKDIKHAQDVATKFSISTKIVILDDIFNNLVEILPNLHTSTVVSKVSKGNIKARLRMITLYYLANQLNYIVAGSSNRSEITIGYFTKHGDGATDMMPLGRLVKSQVRELASFLGIPQAIIDKAPSAGLWEGQTDEGELGISYVELDRYLLTGEGSNSVKQKIEAIRVATNHKRLPPEVPDFPI